MSAKIAVIALVAAVAVAVASVQVSIVVRESTVVLRPIVLPSVTAVPDAENVLIAQVDAETALAGAATVLAAAEIAVASVANFARLRVF